MIEADALRKECMARRAKTSAAERAGYERLAIERLCASVQWMRAQDVLLYAAMDCEMPTDALIQCAIEQKKRVYLPACVDTKAHRLEAYRIYGKDDTLPGAFGIREPRDKTKPVCPKTLDIILTPGLCFDRYGARIGYGAGYYDRYLKRAGSGSLFIGWAMAQQVYRSKLDIQAHDVRLHALCTQYELLFF